MKNIRINKKTKFILAGLAGLILFYVFYRPAPTIDIDEPEIRLFVKEKNSVVFLKMEEYVTGVVAAEMPALFEEEALKSQAVAVRTYTLRRLLKQVKYEMEADMSDDINTCQAYVNHEQFLKKHSKGESLWKKVAKAVNDTRGEILIYDGEPIDAMYHSTCGGRTESARQAWNNDIPYLQSETCASCRDSNHYSDVYVFSTIELARALGEKGDKARVEVVKTTESGRVSRVKVNQKILSGEEFRRRLRLPSNWLEISSEPGEIVINSRGYGHGVGMCQYGANGMAKAGKDYRGILTSYYRGATFLKINY